MPIFFARRKPEPASPLTPISRHGTLSVSGRHIVDSTGSAIALRGISLFWSQWQPQFYNIETLRWLRDDWNISVIRLPLGVASGGFLDNPAQEFQKIRAGIDAAIELGLYVIVDWHAHEPILDEAERFFCQIAKRYGFLPNLIYELWNEPHGRYPWQEVIKPYHIALASKIREMGSRNIIVAGTQNWCRDVEIAANDPIEMENMVYALHFYAGSHGQALRDKAELAVRMGLPLFVTEWGTGNADGDGPLNRREVKQWCRFLDSNRIGYVNWSISDRNESSAALTKSVDRHNAGDLWNGYAITPSGRLVREMLRNFNC